MQFSEVMMLHTAPTYWEAYPGPVFHSERIRDFLGDLLDPAKPGIGRLRLGGTQTDWLSADNGPAGIAALFENNWHLAAQIVAAYPTASREVFDAYLARHVAVVFFDAQRLQACLESHGIEITAEWPEPLFFSLTADWSLHDGQVIWSPQLRIANTSPASPALAPADQDRQAPVAMPAAEAAGLLHRYWMEVDTAFFDLRRSFGLSQASVAIGGIQLTPAVYYCLLPAEPPAERGKFLTAPAREAIEELARILLGTEDVTSGDVAGGFVERRLLAIQRSLRTGQQYRNQYLLLSAAPAGSEAEVEDKAAFVADTLFFTEFSLADKASKLFRDSQSPAGFLALWSGTLTSAMDLMDRLGREVALGGGRSRRLAFDHVARLKSLLRRISAGAYDELDKAASADGDWTSQVASSGEFLARRLTFTPAPDLASLLATLGKEGHLREVSDYARGLRQRAEQVRERFAAVLATLEAHQEEERREQNERSEGNQRKLSWALGALALVTALPLVTGEPEWGRIEASIAAQPESWGPVGEWLSGHPDAIVLGTTGIAAAATALIAVLLLWTLLGARVLSELARGVRRRFGDGFERAERRILTAWHNARPAEKQRDALMLARINLLKAPADRQEEQRARVSKLLDELDRRDRDTCAELVAVWDWLRLHPGGSNVRNVFQEAERFEALTELLDGRPNPLVLPGALCLLRFKGPDFVGGETVISEADFSQGLRPYGFSHGEIANIEAWGERLKAEPPRDFVAEMRNIGVTALHRQEITPPQDEEPRAAAAAGPVQQPSPARRWLSGRAASALKALGSARARVRRA